MALVSIYTSTTLIPSPSYTSSVYCNHPNVQVRNLGYWARLGKHDLPLSIKLYFEHPTQQEANQP